MFLKPVTSVLFLFVLCVLILKYNVYWLHLNFFILFYFNVLKIHNIPNGIEDSRGKYVGVPIAVIIKISLLLSVGLLDLERVDF